MADEEGVIPASPTGDVTEAGSSPVTPVETPPSQEGTASPTPVETPAAPVQVPFGEHPRWKEVQQEKEALRAQNQMLLETLQRVAPQPQAQPDVDPYAGMEPQMAEFYRQMDKRIEQRARMVAEERVRPLEQAYQLGRQQLAEVTVRDFYRDNPEIKPNSEEALQISERVQRGYPLEDAKWIVMGPKYAQQAKEGAQRTQVKIQQAAQKQKASPEGSAGIPATAGGPQAKRSMRETLDAELRAAGL